MAKKKEEIDKVEFALGKENYRLLIIGFAIIIIGFLLMIGGKSNSPNEFNPAIFSFIESIIHETRILVSESVAGVSKRNAFPSFI